MNYQDLIWKIPDIFGVANDACNHIYKKENISKQMF